MIAAGGFCFRPSMKGTWCDFCFMAQYEKNSTLQWDKKHLLICDTLLKLEHCFLLNLKVLGISGRYGKISYTFLFIFSWQDYNLNFFTVHVDFVYWQ